ncbi:hypothetical protein Ddc_13054 [Ditylenchus destructor]|nr:hypothetical protein Ddc_13054 [Ditylenchus destructor]
MENPSSVFGGIDGGWFLSATSMKSELALLGKGIAKGEQVEKYRKIQISEKEVPHLPVNIYQFLSVLDSLKDPEQWDYELPNHPLRATDERQFEVFWNFAMKVIDEKFAELSRPNKKTLTRNPQWWKYIDYLCQSAIVVHRRTVAANKNLTPEWSRVTQLEFDNFNQMFAEIVKRRIHAHEMLEKAERRAELKAQEKAQREKMLDTEQKKAGKTEPKVQEKPKTGKTIKVTAEQL